MSRRLSVVLAAALIPFAASACGAEAVSPLPIQAAESQPRTAVAAPTVRVAPPATSPAAKPAKRITPPPARTRAPQPKRRTTAPRTKPTKTPTESPSATPDPDPACEGAVNFELDVANDELALVPSYCVATGAVLMIRNIGPGEISIDPEDLVDSAYEAGTVRVRFIGAGTVGIQIPQNDTVHTVTVVVRAD